MRLPQALQDPDDTLAVGALTRYYATGVHRGGVPYTGAYFDRWDSTGTRLENSNRFTADDLVAVTLLSVSVPAAAAIELLVSRADEFNTLLADMGDDRDLVDVVVPWPKDWPGFKLWDALTSLPGVGPTTASKLLARKRPRLRPIYDSVVSEVTGSKSLWEPLRALLTSEPDLHNRLLRLRGDAGLPEEVSALRVFDVITWMEGKIRIAEASVRPVT